MKKNLKFIAAAVAAIAMIGCAKDNGENINTSGAKATETTASFSISFPKATRVDDAASTAESKVNTAWVFLFDDATKTLEAKSPLTVTGNSASKSGIKTTTGKHYVYVAVNAPATLDFTNDTKFPQADPEASTPVAGMPMADFLKEIIAGLEDATSKLPAAGTNFFMTGYAVPTFVAPTIDIPNPAANSVNIGIGRAVGKVHMEDAHTSNPENTTVTTLKYKVMNNPIKMRAFQQYEMKDNSGSLANTGSIVNEITGDGETRTNYYRIPDNTPMTGYVAASNVAKAGVYVPENWNDVSTTHNASSLVIQGVVNLDTDVLVIRDANGADVTAAYKIATDKTFFRVWDKTANKWLAPFFSESPSLATIKGAAGISADATDVATSNNKITQDDPLKREFYIANYDKAQAYWRLPLAKDGKSAIARNDYYWVTIMTIAEIGGSTDSDNPDKDGVIPGKDPEPIDKTEVDIKAEITILKWNGVEMDGHI